MRPVESEQKKSKVIERANVSNKIFFVLVPMVIKTSKTQKRTEFWGTLIFRKIWRIQYFLYIVFKLGLQKIGHNQKFNWNTFKKIQKKFQPNRTPIILKKRSYSFIFHNFFLIIFWTDRKTMVLNIFKKF